MLNKLYTALNLSERSQKAVIKSGVFTCLFDISRLFPVALLLLIIDRMIKDISQGTRTEIELLPYILIGVLILTISFLSYKATFKYKYIESSEEDFRQRIALAEKIRKLPMSYLGKRDFSDLTSTIMSDVSVVQGILASDIADFIGGVFFGIFTLIVMAIYEWKMAVALAISIPFAMLGMFICNLISKGINIKNHHNKIVLSDGLQEYLENISVLQSSKQKLKYENELSKKIDKIVPGLMIYEFLAGFAIAFATNFLKTGIGVVIIVGGYFLSLNQITILEFLAFLLVSSRLYEPLSHVCDKLGLILHAFMPASRIKEFLNHPVQEGCNDIVFNNFDISFENVSFAYNEENVLHNVSFTAKQGQITALVGPSGCGKSTLCRLAARFWDVKNGKVLLGGQDVSNIDPETLMKNFAFVFQDVVLFNDTVFNNIKIDKEGASDEEVLKAAKLARCDDFVKRLPNGYNEIIGENGRTLSGGERQRLSIARAFLKDAPIILLDESTASLDPENETKIQESIGKLVENKTVLIIAHRLRSIVDCDKIIVLDSGSISEMGKHEQLLENKGLYHKLYTLQNENIAWSV